MQYNSEEALKLFRQQHFNKEIKPNDKLQISFEKGRFTFRVSTELIYSLREFPRFDLSSNELAVTFFDTQFLTKIQSDDFRFLSKININDFQNYEDRDLWKVLFSEGFSLNITPIFFNSTLHEWKDLFLRGLPSRLMAKISNQFMARLSPEFNLHPLPHEFLCLYMNQL